MAKVLIPIADGSEEMEVVIVMDVLRRAKVDVCAASVMPGRREVIASRGVRLIADAHLDECKETVWDMIVLPGGMPGAANLSDTSTLIAMLRAQIEQNRWLAAICAAPAVVLGRHDLIPNAKATCYPGYRDELAKYVKTPSDARVETDGRLITSQGPGTAMEFALQLVEILCGKERANEVGTAMVFRL